MNGFKCFKSSSVSEVYRAGDKCFVLLRMALFFLLNVLFIDITLAVVYEQADMEEIVVENLQLNFSADNNELFLEQDFEDKMILLDGIASSLKTPNEKERLIENGIFLIRGGEYKKGLNLLEEAWAKDYSRVRLGGVIGLTYLKTGQFDNALEVAKKIQKQDAVNAKASGMKLEGLVYEYKKDLNKAKNIYTELSVSKPDAKLFLANIAVQEGDLAKARQLYQETVDLRPDLLVAWVRYVDFEIRHGGFETAENVIRQAVTKNPRNKKLQVLQTKFYYFAGYMDKVIELSTTALTENHNLAVFYNLRGAAYLHKGVVDEAINNFQKAVELFKNNIDYRVNLILAYEQKQEFHAALNEVKQARIIDADFLPVKLIQVRLLIKADNLQEAESLLRTIAMKEKDNADVYELQGALALAKKQPQQAVTAFKKSYAIKRNGRVAQQLAYALMVDGKKDAGIKVLKDYLHENDRVLPVQMALADSLLAFQDYQQAIDEYQKALEIDANIVAARINLAWLYMQQAQLEKAYLHAEKAFQLAPDNADVVAIYTSVVSQKEGVANAEEILRSATAKFPGNQGIQLDYAFYLAKQQKTEEAMAILTQLLANGQQFEGQEKARKLLAELQE